MSIEAALAETILEDTGVQPVITSYVAFCTYLGEDGEQYFGMAAMPGQVNTTSRGLAETLVDHIRMQQRHDLRET